MYYLSFYLIIQLVSIIHLFEFNFDFIVITKLIINDSFVNTNTFSLLSFINYIYDYIKIKYDNKNNRYILTLFISVIILIVFYSYLEFKNISLILLNVIFK